MDSLARASFHQSPVQLSQKSFDNGRVVLITARLVTLVEDVHVKVPTGMAALTMRGNSELNLQGFSFSVEGGIALSCEEEGRGTRASRSSQVVVMNGEISASGDAVAAISASWIGNITMKNLSIRGDAETYIRIQDCGRTVLLNVAIVGAFADNPSRIALSCSCSRASRSPPCGISLLALSILDTNAAPEREGALISFCRLRCVRICKFHCLFPGCSVFQIVDCPNVTMDMSDCDIESGDKEESEIENLILFPQRFQMSSET